MSSLPNVRRPISSLSDGDLNLTVPTNQGPNTKLRLSDERIALAARGTVVGDPSAPLIIAPFHRNR
eukprot:5762843-Prymnesium_polylepis.1